MNLKSSFIQHLVKKYPAFSSEQLDGYVSENLISPFQVPLKKHVIDDIKSEINQYWNLRNWSAEHLKLQYDAHHLIRPDNYGVCMSYDFHLTQDNRLELIEINTNASFLALGLELYNFWKLKNSAADFSDADLVQMFKDEIRLASPGSTSNSVAIMDEAPSTQRLYLEFLVYQQMLINGGLQSEIVNMPDVDQMAKAALVYNRYTDFYLKEDKSKKLKAAFNAKQVHLSPNPYEYFLLADKQRLIDWTKQTTVEKPKSLLPSYDMGVEPAEKMWTERKHLFFKPKTSYGSKQAYRGSSMSKKAFDSVCTPDFIAQQVSIPTELDFVREGGVTKLKYDLRCYAYKNQLQLIIARLYQGQTTNLRTEGGGFACVTLVD